jgi:putative membrane protein
MENLRMSFPVEETLQRVESSRVETEVQKRKNVGKFTLFLLSFTALIFVTILADSVIFAGEIFESSAIFGYLYVAILSLVLYFVGHFIYNEVVNYLSLKNIDSLRVESKTINQSGNIGEFSKTILNIYEIDQTNFSTVGLQRMEVVQKLDDEVLKPLDEKAEKLVFKYARDNALATAISPLPLFDFIFILFRDVRMVNEISAIYGVRAGVVGNFAILRRVLEQLIFVGVAEFTEEAMSGIAGQTLLSKLSASAGEGVGHGILTLRVGFATMNSIRPIENKANRKGFVGRFIKSLSPFKKKEES